MGGGDAFLLRVLGSWACYFALYMSEVAGYREERVMFIDGGDGSEMLGRGCVFWDCGVGGLVLGLEGLGCK